MAEAGTEIEAVTTDSLTATAAGRTATTPETTDTTPETTDTTPETTDTMTGVVRGTMTGAARGTVTEAAAEAEAGTVTEEVTGTVRGTAAMVADGMIATPAARISTMTGRRCITMTPTTAGRSTTVATAAAVVAMALSRPGPIPRAVQIGGEVGGTEVTAADIDTRTDIRRLRSSDTDGGDAAPC